MDRAELAKRVKEAAYLEGDFTLRSGRKSKYYLDKYLFETQPDILRALGETFVIIRNTKKDYGTAKPYEGKISDADSVLLVEDIATTGGQVLEAAKLISGMGAKLERIVAVIDRQEGARENIEEAGCTFDSLFTKADLGIKT